MQIRKVRRGLEFENVWSTWEWLKGVNYDSDVTGVLEESA